MTKPTIWVPTRSDTNQPVQSQKMVRGWKFWIEKVEELYYSCSTVSAKLICVFVFAYANCLFSHAAAQMVFDYVVLICFGALRSLSTANTISERSILPI